MAQGGRILTVGTSAVELDIFIDNGQGIATDPSDIRFRLFDPTGAEAVTEVEGTRVGVGRYTASGALIPTGFVLGEDWQIKWDITLPGSVSGQFIENFCVALPSLSASFADSSVTTETIFDRVRIDLADPDGKIFTNGLLRRTLEKAVARVNRRVALVRVTQQSSFIFLIAFTSSIQTPIIEVNVVNGTFTPDTDPYIDIVILQMEEILLRSELVALQRLNAATAGSFGSGVIGAEADGISVTDADGVQITTAVGRLNARADLGKFNVNQITEEIEKAISDLRWRLAGGSGKNVTMPRFHRFGYGGYGSY